MKLKLLILTFIISPFFVEAQKIVLKNDEKTREAYYVLKEDRITKHGRYKQFHFNGKLFIDGYYRSGLKDSVWSFYDSDGNLYQKYDYKNKTMIYNSDMFGFENYTVLNNDVTCDTLDRKPVFIGGIYLFKRYVQSKLYYPEKAMRKGIEGKVLLSFVIDRNGDVKDQRVDKGVEESLDKAALEIIMSFSSQWLPGACKGENLEVKIRLPISFKLPE